MTSGRSSRILAGAVTLASGACLAALAGSACATLWSPQIAPTRSPAITTISATSQAGQSPAVPLTAALTIGYTATWGGSATRTLVVLAAGRPPSRALVTDPTGTKVVTVTVLRQTDPACAAAATIAQTGLGTDRWCLKLSGITPGQHYQGVLAGASATLILTLAARDGWPLPALTALTALLITIGLLWLATHLLPDLLTRRELAAAAADDGGIAGLPAWAASAAGRLSSTDILARLRWAKRYGRAQVLGARSQLGQVLDDPLTLLPSCPLRAAAEAERLRPDGDVASGEVLTPAGTRAVSTAEQLLQLVEEAAGARIAFDQICAALMAGIPDPQRATGEALRLQGQALGTGFLSAFTMDVYLTGLRDMLTQLHLLVPVHTLPPPIAAMAALAQRASPAGAGAPAGAARNAGLSVAVAGTAIAVGAIFAVAVVLMLIAVGSVLAVQYVPNQTFGSSTDYFQLVISAFGTSSAVGLLALLLTLRGPQAWYA
jgi:hypothetical protein